jgi:SAM-dependent methyltransferase
MGQNEGSFLHRLFGAGSAARPAEDSSQLREYILGFSSSNDAARAYAMTHLGRLVRTVQLTPPGGPEDRLLEMGAYMQITPTFTKFKHYGEVRGCYLGPLGRTDEKSVVSQDGETFECKVDLFDAERDVFPYPNSHFTAIVCTELLEHLSLDPMHLMSEANRILKPGGFLILSTPNLCSYRGVGAVLQGEHPGHYQHYMRPGDGTPDPRHAREYAPAEMPRLFKAAGFKTKTLETGPQAWDPIPVDEGIAKLLADHKFPTDLRGETIHAVGQKVGPVADRFPKWLYD